MSRGCTSECRHRIFIESLCLEDIRSSGQLYSTTFFSFTNAGLEQTIVESSCRWLTSYEDESSEYRDQRRLERGIRDGRRNGERSARSGAHLRYPSFCSNLWSHISSLHDRLYSVLLDVFCLISNKYWSSTRKGSMLSMSTLTYCNPLLHQKQMPHSS